MVQSPWGPDPHVDDAIRGVIASIAREEMSKGLRTEPAHNLPNGETPHHKLAVSIDQSNVIWEGIAHPINPDTALVIDVLVRANGEWVPGTKITRETHVARPDRAIKKLPKALDELVQSRRGVGFRILIEHLQ